MESRLSAGWAEMAAPHPVTHRQLCEIGQCGCTRVCACVHECGETTGLPSHSQPYFYPSLDTQTYNQPGHTASLTQRLCLPGMPESVLSRTRAKTYPRDIPGTWAGSGIFRVQGCRTYVQSCLYLGIGIGREPSNRVPATEAHVRI